jgi:hypothetical protein
VGNIGFFALRDLGLALKNEFSITTFVETGTYKGQTAAWAAEHFKRVVTIEAHDPHYRRARGLAHKKKNIECVFGDSRVKLKGVISRLRKPALVWLDAHWCGSYEQSLNTPGECPLIDELKVLKKYATQHFILIDDARLFVEPPPKPHDPEQWPTYAEILKLLPENYYVTIWHDAIIAVPQEAAEIVRRFTTTSEMKVVVLTSNKYVHCLPPFAYLFNKFWDAGQEVKVVRYDVRPPKLSGNFSNLAVGRQEDYTWSQGLMNYLAHHSDDLILLMLEDYFIDKPVNTEIIKQCWQLMRWKTEIAKIDLTDDRLKVGHSAWNSGTALSLVKSDDDAPFQTSLQAAIWRKDFLLRFLEPSENAWQFEKRGTKRIIKARQGGEFDGLILGCYKPPLSYINAKGGEGKHPGEWDFKKFPGWMKKELREKRLI